MIQSERLHNAENEKRSKRESDYDIVKPLAVISLGVLFANSSGMGRPFYIDLIALSFLNLMLLLRAVRPGAYKLEFSAGMTAFAIYMTPYLIAFVYTVILAMFQPVDSGVLLRSVSVLVQFAAKMSGVAALIVLFREECLDILFKGMVIGYALCLAYGFYMVGFSGFIYHYTNLSASIDPTAKYFEVHDIGLAAPMLVFYYLFYDNGRKRAAKIVVMSLITVLVFKRIAFAGLVVLCIAHFATKSISVKPKRLLGFTMLVLVMLWIYVSGDNSLFRWAEQYGVNLMGRNALWSYFDQYFEFSLLFAGQGFNFTTRLLSDIVGMNVMSMGGLISGITGLHNDFLRMYIELGCIGSVLWVSYWCLIVPRQLEKKYSTDVAWLWLLLTMYAFVTYATDNTSGYIVFQMTLYLIVFSYAFKSRKDCVKLDKPGNVLPADEFVVDAASRHSQAGMNPRNH